LEHDGSDWANKKIAQPEYYQRKIQQMPLGRFGNPKEIAGFVAELASSESMMSAGGLFELCGAV
jgi:NAD(P)-dependent dehydrogenase (short-subunit alcohol dehydrogenase family)